MTPPPDLQKIRSALLSWFSRHERDLPWRRTYDPYHVWISEIMLQQTQMERVVTFFNSWMEKFPTLSAVAAADKNEILKAWEGLGYYTRARNIHKTAKILAQNHDHRLPSTPQQLLALPGIGPYTAAAILSIAYNLPYPVIDANVERVFARLCDIGTPIKHTTAQTQLKKLAHSLLTDADPRIFNQALMEFGALVCTPKNPQCKSCVLQTYCLAHRLDVVGERPIPGRRQKSISIDMACGILHHEGLFFIQQRQDDDVWGGLWEFPGGRIKKGESPEEAMIREVREETDFAVTDVRYFKTVIHHYMHYKVTLHGFFCSLAQPDIIPNLQAAQCYTWAPFPTLTTYPFPAGHRKLIEFDWPQLSDHD